VRSPTCGRSPWPPTSHLPTRRPCPRRRGSSGRRNGDAGILPLSPGELARVFNDLWRTKKAARRDRAQGWSGGDRRLAERAFWAATAVTYRAPGQVRGRPQRALVTGELSCPEAARLALAPLLGAVTAVAVAGTLRRPADRPPWPSLAGTDRAVAAEPRPFDGLAPGGAEPASAPAPSLAGDAAA
jgi:hypothetical protein